MIDLSNIDDPKTEDALRDMLQMAFRAGCRWHHLRARSRFADSDRHGNVDTASDQYAQGAIDAVHLAKGLSGELQ